MKKWKMWVSTIVLLSMLCACRSAPRAFIPLMKVSNLGECRLCKWDTEKNEIVDIGRPLFENSEDPHSLLYTLWDGHDCFILSDDRTRVLETNGPVSVDLRKSNRQVFYEDYTLLKEDDNSFVLQVRDQEYRFRVEANVSIDGECVRGERLGLSGFCVDEAAQTVSILLNAFSFELNRINLYICQVSLADGVSRIQEVKNCPTTLSPAFPPIGTNVLAIHGEFHVLSNTQISRISADTCEAESVFEVLTLRNSRHFATKKTHGYLMTRLGYYDGKYVVSVIADPQTVSEASYLCLVDRGNVVAVTKVDSEYIAPNLYHQLLAHGRQ